MIDQAVLLVGGRGTRLWPLTETTPKGLVPVAGNPFLDLQLELVRRVGVSHVVLAVGTSHLAEWQRYADEERAGMTVELAVEEEPLDTAGSLVMSLERLHDRFLVLNGDVVIETDLSAFLERSAGRQAAIALARVDDPSAYGVVVTDDRGTVLRFVEKPPPGTAPANTVSAGIYVLDRTVFESYEPGPLSFERVVFPSLAEAGRLAASVVEGPWLDIGTPELLLSAHAHVLSGSSILSPMEPTADPWNWVAPDATVHHSARLSEAVVMSGAIVGANATVERSILADRAEVGANSVITDVSVIGPGAVVGSDVELARGIRVGPDAIIGAGSIRFNPPD